MPSNSTTPPRLYATIDPLPHAEEIELIQRWQHHQDHQALDTLCRANLRFVMDIASKYTHLTTTPLYELAAIGAQGLLHAAQRYDADRDFKFITYAVWWIRQAIQKHLAEDGLIRVPVNVHVRLKHLTQCQVDRERKTGRSVPLADVADDLDVPSFHLAALALWDQGGHFLRLDAPIGEGDETPHSLLADEQAPDALDDVQVNQCHALLHRLLRRLNKRERFVLQHYYGLQGRTPHTLQAIGTKMGVSRERVRQIKNQALEQLRMKARCCPLEETL